MQRQVGKAIYRRDANDMVAGIQVQGIIQRLESLRATNRQRGKLSLVTTCLFTQSRERYFRTGDEGILSSLQTRA